jgi:hypothetical protein
MQNDIKKILLLQKIFFGWKYFFTNVAILVKNLNNYKISNFLITIKDQIFLTPKLP